MTENSMAMAIDGIFARTNANVKEEEGDYYVNGLLYCGKCNTPKQVELEIFGSVRRPFCLCKCATEERDAKEEAHRQAERNRRIMEMRRVGFPDAETAQCRFERDDGANEYISSACKRYFANFERMKADGKGLLLFGSVGTGKSFFAACIANALLDNGVPCLMTDFKRLANTISGMFEGKQEYIDRLNRFDLLIIDDLATERDTEFMGEIVHNIIDSRYRSGLPLIVTTNLTAEELKKPADVRKQRIYSRLLEMCVPIHVEGKDRRREKLKSSFEDYKDLLGL